MRQFSTPMMKQYCALKEQYQDYMLLFRLGDFYELFLDDAEVGAKILDIVLTQRPSGKDGKIPMAGIPFHAADSYIAKLIKAGHRVAICEQLTEPKAGNIVERDVIRIITPGTVLDEKSLEQKQHNYTMSIALGNTSIGIALADISTGDFQVTECAYKDNLDHVLLTEISRFYPRECIISPQDAKNEVLKRILEAHRELNIYTFPEWAEYKRHAEQNLLKHFGLHTLKTFDLENKKLAQESAAALLGYFAHTQKHALTHLRDLKTYHSGDYVVMDHSTSRNLELFSTLRDRSEKGSLVDLIDVTLTAMGGRLLREWIAHPLSTRHSIKERLDAVEELLKSRPLRSQTRKLLQDLYDIERIISRLSVGVGIAIDLVNLKQSLRAIVEIKELLKQANASLLMKNEAAISENLFEVIAIIEKRIEDDPPVSVKEGGVIKPGIHTELDELRDLIHGGKKWIAEMEVSERKRTGINSLKVRFNQIFGYYIEITKANAHLVPKDYERRQSMVNTERFSTPELKAQEEKILVAQEQVKALEYRLFQETVAEVLRYLPDMQRAGHSMAEVDCLASFAQVAETEQYCKPTITDAGSIEIKAGRHPMVEKAALISEPFVPNDAVLNTTDHQLIILTGPNMAGKSVFMRQVVLLVLMAHVGMFIPAKSATITLVDRIFVRSGASDAISAGLSTFMVEMVETAHILHHATSKSLVIMDEIGRGTSTYDGISIAWAVAEYLVTSKKHRPKTLFATHYHELQSLEDQYPKYVKNYQMSVAENNGDPVFLHTIQPGRASHSYAVVVAQRAGLPKEVTDNAVEILTRLEKERHGAH